MERRKRNILAAIFISFACIWFDQKRDGNHLKILWYDWLNDIPNSFDSITSNLFNIFGMIMSLVAFWSRTNWSKFDIYYYCSKWICRAYIKWLITTYLLSGLWTNFLAMFRIWAYPNFTSISIRNNVWNSSG